MISLHLYPSPFLNESRILREARSLSTFDLFDQIDLVGVGGADLDAEEHVGAGIRIRRVGLRQPDSRLLGKVVATLKWALAVYRQYRKARVACINCHSVATLPLGCALKWVTGAPLVYSAHELETETNGLKGIRKVATKLVERALIGYVDYSIFVGHAINNWYRDRYGLLDTATVYNCPPLTNVEPTDYFRRTLGIDPELPIFLYQGVISKDRGIPKLIEAFAGLERHGALVIMGYGDLAEWVAGCAKQQSNVFYHPAVPPDRLLAHTVAADFGLSVIEPTSLSYDYCMPNKLFEYLMAGKPVLVSPTQEQRSFVERYGVGEVTRDTEVGSIREGVLRLLSKDRQQLATAIDRVRREFSWERQEEVLRHVYCGALGLKPKNGRREHLPDHNR